MSYNSSDVRNIVNDRILAVNINNLMNGKPVLNPKDRDRANHFIKIVIKNLIKKKV